MHPGESSDPSRHGKRHHRRRQREVTLVNIGNNSFIATPQTTSPIAPPVVQPTSPPVGYMPTPGGYMPTPGLHTPGYTPIPPGYMRIPPGYMPTPGLSMPTPAEPHGDAYTDEPHVGVTDSDSSTDEEDVQVVVGNDGIKRKVIYPYGNA